MKLQEKIPGAKQAIRFISTHDDDSWDVVEAVLNELKAFIDSEKKEAIKRRQQKEGEK